MHTEFTKKYIRYLPAMLWAIFILVLCMLPGKDLPKAGWMDYLSLDKIVHASFYFTLGILMLNASKHLHQVQQLSYYSKILNLTLCILYGIGIEYLQEAFTDRHFDWWDATANSVGALLATLLYERITQHPWFRSWDDMIP